MNGYRLFVDQSLERKAALVRGNATGEPQGNLAFSRFNRVRTVTDITSYMNSNVTISTFRYSKSLFQLTDVDGIVATDSAGSACQGVGSTQHDTTGLDDVLASPDHTDNRTRKHVVDQAREEGLTSQVLVLNFRE